MFPSSFSLFNSPRFCLLKDIGRSTSGPEINYATGEVFITYSSNTKCAADPAQNYTSTIIFTCQRGLELVSQHFRFLYDNNTYTCTVTVPLCCTFEQSSELDIFIQGSPQMLRLQECVYLFEWATPIVCSDATHTSGCQLTDSQLQFTFNMSTLSGDVQVSSIGLLSAHQNYIPVILNTF